MLTHDMAVYMVLFSILFLIAIILWSACQVVVLRRDVLDLKRKCRILLELYKENKNGNNKIDN